MTFEVLSPGNTKTEMARKLSLDEGFGVEEYYVYDRDHNRLQGYLRSDNSLKVIESLLQ